MTNSVGVNMTNRQILLNSRPVGMPTPENFSLVDRALPSTGPGQFLMKTEYLGLAPAARIRMGEGESYAAPTPLGSVVYGQAAGTVLESRHPDYRAGDKVVVSDGGWQEYVVSDGSSAVKADEAVAPLTVWLGALGVSGMTAYVGLLEHGYPKAGETVVVSAASGAVGSVVGQIAKIKGCRVVGIAGGAHKSAHVTDVLGFDACVDYRAGRVSEALGRLCPDGVDVYFDNVGGLVRDAVFGCMNGFGRIVLCGMISEYNAQPQPGPNWMSILTQRLTIRGFLLRDHLALRPRFIEDMAGWYREGRIVVREDITPGIENTPNAFIGMLGGSNFGKTLVKIA